MSPPKSNKTIRCPGALARNWKLAAGVATIIAVAALVGVMCMPRRYQSEARLMAQAAAGQSIDSVIQAVRSQPMLDRLAQSLEAPQTLAQLEKNIDVSPADSSSPADKSNILSIQCRADSSAAAQQTAARLVELCLEQYSAPAASAASATGKSPAVNPAQLQGELTGAQELLAANRTELEAAEKSVAALELRLASIPEDLPPPKPPAPPSVGELRARLEELEAQERELAATRSEVHPLLRAVRQQVADLQSVIGEEPATTVPATTTAPSPRKALEAELREAQSQAKALRTRQQSLAALEAKLQSDLGEATAKAAVAAAAPPPPTAVDRQPAAAFSLTLMQPASIAIELTLPRRLQVLALGLLVALAGGFGSAFIAAFFRPVLNTPGDLERLLEVPLVGVLPRAKGPAAAGV